MIISVGNWEIAIKVQEQQNGERPKSCTVAQSKRSRSNVSGTWPM